MRRKASGKMGRAVPRLDRKSSSREDVDRLMHTPRRILIFSALLSGCLCSSLYSQQPQNSTGQKKEQAPLAGVIDRLTIEVTGGDANKPVENASVYVKTEEERAILKNKKTELNVKTNQQGIAHIPDPPKGRVLIQIVVPGWKTFGKWYDITEQKQVIKIHLERPPQWY
jgi:hypothetical protein